VTNHSRRSFIKRASIGAAAVGAAVAVPAAFSTDADADTVPPGAVHDGPLVAWVKDTASGEITVHLDNQTVVYQDKKLAAKLSRIAARASKS
jgi:hypothetical protein